MVHGELKWWLPYLLLLFFPLFPETEVLKGKHDNVASKQYLCIMGLVSTLSLLRKLMAFEHVGQ